MAPFPPISRAGFPIPESFTLFNSLLHSDLEDKELRFTGWQDLKQRAPIGPLNIPKMMQEIEQESLNNGKPLVDHVDALFNSLIEKLRPDFEATKLPGEELQATELHLTALQTRLQKRYEDETLQTIWNQRLRPLFELQADFQDVAPPNGVEAIRAWLNSPANAERVQQITQLDLSALKLKALPSEIWLFTELQCLELFNNQLSFLPESFGNLSTLRELYLENNQLSFLPESFGNLSTLRKLYLENNQLSFLPESFGNLRALTVLSLYGNPLMLVSDKERKKIINYRTYLTYLEPLKKHTPQSPLATLFHAIIFNKPVDKIQQAYAQLSSEMQHRIAALVTQHPTYSGSAQSTAVSSPAASSSSDPSPALESLFTDMGLFARSVRKAAYDLYESLGPEQKKLVQYHIWDLAGRPETDDSNWGEHHVFDHVLCFTDALERATQN